jgi:hypothetical protein
MASPAQITASRANGALSHGPVTSDGKSISSRNSLKLGLYSEALIIPGEDPEDFEQLSAEYHAHYQPVGPAETSLLNQAIVAQWMQRRYFRIEAAVINFRAASHPDPELAVGAAYDDDHKHGNTLNRLFRRQQAASRDWREALQLLERHQGRRRQQEAEAEMEAATDLEIDDPAGLEALEVEPSELPSGSFRAAFQTLHRQPVSAPENLALRL